MSWLPQNSQYLPDERYVACLYAGFSSHALNGLKMDDLESDHRPTIIRVTPTEFSTRDTSQLRADYSKELRQEAAGTLNVW